MRQKDVVFVTTLYRDILGHNPKPASLNSWVALACRHLAEPGGHDYLELARA